MKNNVINLGRRGMTLMELLVVAVIIGLFFGVAPKFILQTLDYFLLTRARTEIQRDARISMDEMVRSLRSARTGTIAVDQDVGQPPNSRISFTTVSGAAVTFTQSGRRLLRQQGSAVTELSANLRVIAFTFSNPPSSNPTVALTMEKAVGRGRTKAFQLIVESVQLMN